MCSNCDEWYHAKVKEAWDVMETDAMTSRVLVIYHLSEGVKHMAELDLDPEVAEEIKRIVREEL